jgi:hypothetical protein
MYTYGIGRCPAATCLPPGTFLIIDLIRKGEEMALLFFIWLQLKVHDYKQGRMAD